MALVVLADSAAGASAAACFNRRRAPSSEIGARPRNKPVNDCTMRRVSIPARARAVRVRFGAVALLLLVAGCSSLDLASVSLPGRERSVESRLAFANLLERRHEEDKARLIYEKLLVEQPGQPQALHRLAVMASKQGKFAEADKLFAQALGAGGPSAQLFNDIGYNHYLQDRLSDAEAAFRQAVESDGEFRPAWTNLGLVLGQQRKFDESRVAFEKATDVPAQVHCNLAYVHAQLGELEPAREQYLRALALDPRLTVAAEGLLQVSSRLPGREPVTIVSTTARPPKPPAVAELATVDTTNPAAAPPEMPAVLTESPPVVTSSNTGIVTVSDTELRQPTSRPQFVPIVPPTAWQPANESARR